MLKNNKGITLIALVITIIIILILASVATTSGMSAFNTAKFNNAKAQFQAMQNYANSWYEESDRNKEVLNYGEDISEKANLEELEKMQKDLVTPNFENEGFKYFSKDYISNILGIEGISYDFLINVSSATVLLFGGITYQGYTYYSAEDFGINLIAYHNLTGEIQFETKFEEENIVVYNIQFPDNIEISKYRVQYQNEGEQYWKTLTTDKKQEYEYKDAHGNLVKDKNAWNILIPTINEEFFSNSQPIEGEDRELALLNVKIRIIATDMASEEKSHTIVKRKETTVDKLELSNTDIIMPVGGTRKIIATPTIIEGIVYYAKINGNYYKIVKNDDGKYIVQENITEISNPIFELKAETDKDNVSININQETKEITLTGTKAENSIISTTYDVKKATCNVQVLSKLDYLDLLLGNEEEITEEFKEKVKVDGYSFTTVTDTKIDGISLQAPSEIKVEETGKIIVNLQNQENITIYYAIIDGLYYKIVKNDTKLTVERQGKTESEISIKEKKVEATPTNNNLSITSINGFEINLRGVSVGTSTINVNYGGKTASCTIKVILSISSLKNNGDEVGEKTTLTDDNDDEITIPEGFKVADDSSTLVKDGIVVVAPDESEFVWVPVENINSMVMCKGSTGANNCNITKSGDKLVCTTHSKEICGKLYKSDSSNLDITLTTQVFKPDAYQREPDVLIDTKTGDYTTGNSSRGVELLKSIVGLKGTDDEVKAQWKNQLQKEFEEMAKSVYENKGFYVGRYELSLRTLADGTTYVAQSKAKQKSTTAGKEGSKTWYGLYQREKEYSIRNNLTDIVGSTMIWGSQYEQMALWMLANGYTVTSYKSENLKGAVKNNTYTTGVDGDQDILNNVYDLLGSYKEWTLEADFDDDRHCRGGEKGNGDYSIVRRWGASPYYEGNTNGSRFTLYLK